MDGINQLYAGSVRAQAQFEVAAKMLALAGLPTEAPAAPDQPSSFVASDRGIDVAEQLTTMIISASVHKATVAALRSSLEMYRATLDLVRH